MQPGAVDHWVCQANKTQEAEIKQGKRQTDKHDRVFSSIFDPNLQGSDDRASLKRALCACSSHKIMYQLGQLDHYLLTPSTIPYHSEDDVE